MSVKRFIFYEMFKFICGKNEVKGLNHEQNKKNQQKQNIINPANLTNSKNTTYLNKISHETINKFNPKIDENFYIERKNHANANKFIKNYNEINKTKFPPIEE